MNLQIALGILFLAAVLEAGGDALVRTGLHAHALVSRALFLALGALVLFAYGLTVNIPPWDFGRLLGVYVVFFFVVAQFISWIFFHRRPSGAVLLGGLFIIAGGTIISCFSAR